MKQSTFSAVMANSIKNLLQGYTKGIRFVAVLMVLLTMGIGQAWAETHTIGWGSATGTAGTYTNFTATSGTVTNVVSFSTAQNGASSAPAYNSSSKELRLYYGSSGNGCSITLTPINGVTITAVKITASSTSYTPTVKYNVNGGTDIAGTWSSTTMTISGISATSSLKIRNANTSNKQLRIKTIEITYASNKTVYLKPTSAWDVDGAKFAVYYFNNSTSTNGWSSLMTKVDNKCNNDVYKAEIPSSYTNLIFVRLHNTATAGDWNKKWDQTADLTLSGTNNMYTISAHGSNGVNASGSWSAYKEEVQVTYNFQKTDISNVTECVVKGQTTANKSYNLLGWKLEGWYKEAACTNQWNFSTTVTSEMTLYAKWSEPATTTVYLNANCNGVNWTQDNADIWVHAFMSSTDEFKDIQLTPVNTCDVNWLKAEGIPYGVDKLIFLRVADGAGVVWSGSNFWNQAAEIGYSGSTSYYQMDNWSAVKTATAYQPSTYTISYNSGGGSGSMASTTVECDGSITLRANSFTRTGYTFNGWKDADGNTYTDKAIISNVKSNITLTAQWKANTNTPYKVKHYKQQLDGTYSTTPDETENCTGTTAASVTPTVKSYSGFKAPSTQTVTIAADGSTVVEYKYTRNSYTLTWNLDGGTITTGGTPAGSVKYGAALKVPTVTKNGYQFDIWNPSVPATMPAADATYTAKWKKLYTVTWMVNDDEQESQTDVAGTNLTKPAEPKAPNSCKDKIFAGWTTINGYSHPTNQPNDLFSCDEATNKTVPVDGITYYAVFATEITEEGGIIDASASVTISDYANKNNWTNGTKYTTVNVDANITAKVSGQENTGKYYTSGTNWRLYQTEQPKLTFSAKTGCTIKTIKVTYSNSNNGVLTYDGQNISSTQAVTINAISAIFGVGNTSSDANGQVRITEIDVTYTLPGGITTTYSDYVTSCIPTYTITWKNDDGTELDKDYVEHGVVPSYDGEEPTKAATAQYTYTFNGWTPEIVAATEDATYTATYIATTNTYTITWKDWDGTVLETDNKVPYGTTPTYNGKAPNRPEDNTYKHTFAGWDPEVKNVDGDQVYTAKYTQEKHQITITWMVNGEEYTLGDPSTTVLAGEQVAKLPTEPTPDAENNIYCGQVFAGWTDKPIEGEPITYAPALLFKTLGSSPTIYKEGDKTTIIFYAVFADYAD